MVAQVVNVQVGEELVRPIIESKVQAAIVEGLGHADQLMQSVISAVITMKVDRDGKPGQGYSNDQTLLHYLCTKAIRETAEMAVREWIATQQPKLKAELTKQLDRQKAQLAEMMVLGLAESLKSAYKFSVDVEFNKAGRD
jgi:hypothetical protein